MNFDIHAVRVLRLLGENGGAATRWLITKKALQHVKGEARDDVLNRLIRSGHIVQLVLHKARGTGPKIRQYKLTAKGSVAYTEVSKSNLVLSAK